MRFVPESSTILQDEFLEDQGKVFQVLRKKYWVGSDGGVYFSHKRPDSHARRLRFEEYLKFLVNGQTTGYFPLRGRQYARFTEEPEATPGKFARPFSG